MKRNLLILFSVFLVLGCDRGLDEPFLEEDDVVLVMVDGRPVTLPMLEVLMRMRDVDEDDEAGMRQLLDELIRIRVMANAAEGAELDRDAHVRAERMIKDMETLYVRFLEQHQQEHPVADEDIEQVYQEQAARAGDRQFLLETILYADQAAALTDIARVEDGDTDFETLATEAEGLGLRVEDGLWVDRSQVPDSFAAVLEETTVGELVSAPLHTGEEWRLVRLADTRPLDMPALGEVRDGIRRHLTRQQAEVLIEQHYEAAEIVPMLPMEELEAE